MDEEEEMITVPTLIDDWESPLGSSVGYTVKKKWPSHVVTCW